jgi:possible dehydrogenase
LTAFTVYSLPFMRRKSRIIQIASAAAFLPQREFSVYAATKSYVYSFSLSLREELREREIGVTAVCPGPVDTEFFKVAGNEGKLRFAKSFFMAKPKKVAMQALMDSVLKRPVSVYGFSMKLFYAMSRVIPDFILIKFLRKFYT